MCRGIFRGVPETPSEILTTIVGLLQQENQTNLMITAQLSLHNLAMGTGHSYSVGILYNSVMYCGIIEILLYQKLMETPHYILLFI